MALAVLGVVSCGRIGFDPIDGTDAGDGVSSRVRVGAGVDADAYASDGDGAGQALEASDALDGTASPLVPDAPASVACLARSGTDFCAALPALAADPVIDGLLDCGPSLAAVVPVGWSGFGVTADSGMEVPAGNAASLAAAWRPGGLYVFIQVTDPDRFPADVGSPAFFGDGAEVFVDSDGVYTNPPAYDDPGSSQIVVSAPVSASAPGQRGEIYRYQVDEGASTGSRMAAFPTATGYVVEAFVVAADLGLPSWTLAAGERIGFDVAVDVSYSSAAATGNQGHRMGQYFLHVGTPPDLPPYQDVRSFCTPTLDP